MKEFKNGSLWLSFRLENTDYCILSEYIESIGISGAIDALPDSHPPVVGITPYGKDVIRVLDMREVFGKISLKDNVDAFGIMKDMHVSWVVDLDRYVNEGGEFTKAVNPHKCKFGLWYDTFVTDNLRLRRLLKKISGPHENIHGCGAEILKLRAQDGDHQAEIQALLEEADRICQEEMVPLLDRLIDVYRSANRGVVLVIGDGEKHVGLLVDEVKTLIPCTKTRLEPLMENIKRSSYLGGTVLDDDHIMLEVDADRLLSSV